MGEKQIQPLSLLLHPVAISPNAVPLIVLIGLPGSGKSTIAAKLLAASPCHYVISTDAIRAQLFGDAAIQGPWMRVWREVEQQFWRTVPQIVTGSIAGVVYDATNVVRKQRREAIALARRAGFTHLTGLWLNPPLEVCLERNYRRDRQVPIDIVLKMQRCLVGAPPALGEGFDRLIEVKGQMARTKLADRGLFPKNSLH